MDLNLEASKLLDLIDEGRVNSECLREITYTSLYALYCATAETTNGSEIYSRIKNLIDLVNEEAIKNRKVTIAIMPLSISAWFADKIIELFAGVEDVNIYILPCMTWLNDDMRVDEYIDCFTTLKERFPDITRGTYDFEKNRQLEWDEVGVDPDIILWTNPYPLTRGCYDAFEIPLNKLMCYIPYGINTADNIEKTFHIHAHFQMPFMQIMWKNFVTTSIELEEAKIHSFIHGDNMVYSGYPKMDVYFEDKEIDVNKIWKKPEGAEGEDYLRVIYSPHHSLKGTNMLAWSTFEENGEFMYELAKKHSEVSWIIRPHPQLGERLVQKNVMTIEEYNSYLEKWNNLPNARVSEREEYSDIFSTSSAMIQDCCSFLAEYLYQNKPMCFLFGEETSFNPLGELCASVIDMVNGDDYEAIDKFVQSLSKPEDQEKVDKRWEVISDVLNYYRYNGMTASEFIVYYILGKLH